MEVLAVQVRSTEWVAGCTPVPESAIVAGELFAVLVTVTVPVLFPAIVGLNTTLNVRFCPLLKVIGTPAPVRLKPAPVS